MPSPFPGMDPYLENPKIWRGAHHWFITAADEQLQPQLNHARLLRRHRESDLA